MERARAGVWGLAGSSGLAFSGWLWLHLSGGNLKLELELC